MIVLGIDPGLSGGLALVAGSPGQRLRLIDAMDVPVHGDAAKRRVNVGAVLDFIQRNAPDRGLIERAQLIPDQNISAGGIYMRAVGALEAATIPQVADIVAAARQLVEATTPETKAA